MEQKKMSKKEFWSRFSSYVVFGAILPFTFLAWRFNLFSKVNKLSIGGWGVLGIIVVAAFFISMIKAIKKGLPYSYGVQVLGVIAKISIPILLAFSFAYLFQDIMTELTQFLGVLFICETIAGFVNPLPQWAHENKIKEEENNLKTMLKSLGIIKGEEGND